MNPLNTHAMMSSHSLAQKLVRTWTTLLLVFASLVLTLVSRPAAAQTATAPGAQADPAQATPTQTLAVPADLASQNVAIITIGEEIDRVTSMSFKRRLKAAEDAGADAVVVELDTPGGELGAVLEICEMIEQTTIPRVFAWVNTNAYSGGAIIALACDKILVNDTVSFGDALPIAMSFGMLNALPESERQKALVPLLSQVVYSARKNGYDEYLVQAIVSIGVELWLVEDVQSGVRWCIDRAEYNTVFGEEPAGGRPLLVSASGVSKGSRPGQKAPAPAASQGPSGFSPASPALASLAPKVIFKSDLPNRRPVFTSADRGRFRLVEYVCDGRGPVVLKGQDMALLGVASNAGRDASQAPIISPPLRTLADLQTHLGAKAFIRLDRSWSEVMVIGLTSWPARALLIVVFIVAMFVEMTHPGVTIPGAIAGLALLGLIAPPLLIGLANWWEIAAIIVGVMLLLLEVFVIPGFGVAGFLGLVLLFGGLIFTFIPASDSAFPDSPHARSQALYGVATVLMSLVTSSVAIYYISKNFGSLPIMNRLILKTPAGEDLGEGMLAAMGEPDRVGPQVGDRGTAVTPLRPSGRIQIGDQLYDVVAEMGYISAGQGVRVTSVSEFRVTVDALSPGETGVA